MLSELSTTYRSPAFLLREAFGWERDAAMALRRAVFCIEQGIFVANDRDALDDEAVLLVALSMVAGDADEVVGTVRFHRGLDPTGECPGQADIYWGSRLAVHPKARGAGRIGASLIERAVCSAHALGATHFFAHVQLQNVAMFEALHWHVLDHVVLHGRRHAVMQADLDYYPALADATDTQVIFAKASE
jgi:putative N-acetyltransferase (TIGR04045 family)